MKGEMDQNENLTAILKEIENYFSNSTPEDINKAIALCTKYGIDLAQFAPYYNPHDLRENIILQKITETPPTHIKEVSSLEQKVHSEDEPDRQDVNIAKVTKPSAYFSVFPYKLKEIETLSTGLINSILYGCLHSYGSQEIMRVFNPAEFLGKMTGIHNLRLNKEYKHNLAQNIKDNIETAESAFVSVIKYLDNFAYNEHKWGFHISKFEHEYSTVRNSQKERIKDIPESEKIKFIKSLYQNPFDFHPAHYEHAMTELDFLTKSGIKEDTLNFLLIKLKEKWDNKDPFS